jgi:hypothetical protein
MSPLLDHALRSIEYREYHGVKLAAYPRDVARRGIKFDLDAINRDVGAEIGKLRRELATKGISREEFNEKLRYQLDKKKKAVDEARERLR